MTRRTQRWILWSVVALSLVLAGLYVAARVVADRFEPTIRAQAIEYLENRFKSRVELKALRVRMPKLSALEVLSGRGGAQKAGVEGEGLTMRFAGSPDLPPLFTMRKFSFEISLSTLAQERKTVESVAIEGMQIHIPPKGERPQVTGGGGGKMNVVIEDVVIQDALLVILPRDRSKKPLDFEISRLHLKSVGPDQPMAYDASLTNPKPPGRIVSEGKFGPWAAGEPGDTPLAGKYVFSDADLGVFKGIAGILNSTGTFEGTLDSVNAKGQATVPDFRLTMAGNPVSLRTDFECLVDGTNGNTVLKPVKAVLGSTRFTTTGGVIKHEGDRRRSIKLRVSMPDGNMKDLVRLATKGPPFLDGRIKLNSSIEVPPLSGKVKEKLILDGRFELRQARFLRAQIQDKLDELSRKGQGRPTDQTVDEVLSNLKGRYRLEGQVMTFRSLTFSVPGADVDLAGSYDIAGDVLDFHGTLKLTAKVSQTMTGWKRWALKPVDPFLAKNGAGTFLRIRVEGSSKEPKFGLDR